MKRLVPESQVMEDTDSLGISALSLEGVIRTALRGKVWRVWRCCFCLVLEQIEVDQARCVIGHVGASCDFVWLKTASVGLLWRGCLDRCIWLEIYSVQLVAWDDVHMLGSLVVGPGSMNGDFHVKPLVGLGSK